MISIISRRLNRPLVLTGSAKKVKNQLENVFAIQSKNICHKDDLDPENVAMRIPPFPYKEKRLSFLQHYFKVEGFNPTTGKFTENTKVVSVEGNVGVGKELIAAKLADLMGMKYFPDISFDRDYKMDDGSDYRDLNLYLHEDVHYPDYKSALVTQNPYHAGHVEIYSLRMKTHNYMQAVTHLLNTGDGVVVERSPWSGTVFTRANKDLNLLGQDYLKHYWEVRSRAFMQLFRPHVVIYLDAPVDKCLENAKVKNSHGCGEHLTLDYLEAIERNMKKHFLPVINQHAEIFTYKLNEPITDEKTAQELSEMIVDELGESDMDEYFIKVTSNDTKFEDWRHFDTDERWNDLRMWYTRDKTEALEAFEFYPYYVDELWPAHSLLWARHHVTYDWRSNKDYEFKKNRPFREKLWGRKETYDEKDSKNWYIKTGFGADHIQSET